MHVYVPYARRTCTPHMHAAHAHRIVDIHALRVWHACMYSKKSGLAPSHSKACEWAHTLACRTATATGTQSHAQQHDHGGQDMWACTLHVGMCECACPHMQTRPRQGVAVRPLAPTCSCLRCCSEGNRSVRFQRCGVPRGVVTGTTAMGAEKECHGARGGGWN